MSSPGPHLGGQSRARAAPITLDLRLCLNRHHKDAGCQRCVQVCPVGAIREDTLVQVDLQKCVGCGVCVSACPTDALSLTASTEKRIWSRRLRELESQEKPLTLACSTAMPSGGAMSERETLELPCLAAASPVLLAAAVVAGGGRLLLDDSACSQCRLGSTRDLLTEAVDTAQRLLTAFGRKAEFRFASPPAQTASPGEAAAGAPVPSRDAVHSRRGLLRLFGMGAAGLVAQMTPTLLDEVEQGKNLATQAPPRDRIRLADLLTPLAPPAATTTKLESLPTTRVDIGEGCCACALCSRFCPTTAIRSSTHGATFELLLVPVYCVGCGICAKICPAGCVSLSGEVDPASLTQEQASLLVRLEVAPCTACGTPCASGDSEPICFACRASIERRQSTRS